MTSFSDIVTSFGKNGKAKHEEEVPGPTTVVDFSSIGGLSRHISMLREMVIFPLIYKDVYEKFNIKPPRGILFYGPPGTGKTFIAKALATECGRCAQVPVSFFSRKGSDILDKWVGESEKKLKALFEKALQTRPSIIFFDEIDALAPVRSSRQDQVHTSVVATLLALMDGLDTIPSGGVVIIGATNRLNSIDPALRRTGRFDRELYFPLPCKRSRFDILQVITKHWQQKPSYKLLKYLADQTTGFCGSDLQALCSDAVLCCLKRYYPTILSSPENPKAKKVTINVKKLQVQEIDFLNAQNNITLVARKHRLVHYRMSRTIEPLLIRQLDEIVGLLKSNWSHFWDADYQYKRNTGKRYIGRIIIIGNSEQGHTRHIAPALLHHLEHLPTHVIDVQEIHENAGNRPLEQTIIQKFRLTRQSSPSILYTPSIDSLWDIIDSSTKAVFMSLLYELDAELPLLIITTSSIQVPIEVQEYFTKHSSLIYRMGNPNLQEREEFFGSLFLEKALTLPPPPPITLCDNINDKVASSRNSILKNRYSRRLRGLEAIPISLDETLLVNEGRSYRKRTIPQANYMDLGTKRIKIEKPDTNENNTVLPSSSMKIKQTENKSTAISKENLLISSGTLPTPTSNPGDVLPAVKKSEETIKNSKSEVGIDLIDDGGLPTELQLSRPQLLYLYQRTVRDLTINSTCVSLELLYDKLNSCIQAYEFLWNRHSLLKKIEQILNKHEEDAKQYDNQHRFEGDAFTI